MKNKSNYLNHSFKQTLEQLEDTRNQRLLTYPLEEVLFLVLIGNLSSCDELTSIEAFGEEKLEWLRKDYPYKNGIPSHDTLNRVLGVLDKKKFEELFVI